MPVTKASPQTKRLDDWISRQSLQLQSLEPAEIRRAALDTGLDYGAISKLVESAKKGSPRLEGGSATTAPSLQRDVYGTERPHGPDVKAATWKGHEVTGEVLRHWVDDRGHARASIRFTGVALRDVVEMFTKEDLRAFFPTARSYGRAPNAQGGQSMYENPLPGPPIMYTVIEPTAEKQGRDGLRQAGIQSTFTGLMCGSSTVKVSEDGRGGVILDEDTNVKPAFRSIPGQSLAERVPFFGSFMRAGRELAESIGGAVLAQMHQGLVPALAIDAMVKTLARRAADRLASP